jgi:uncharacterized membrane protein YfcA
VVAGLAVFVGALVQGSVGFGMGMLAAPVFMLAVPETMPASLLMLGIAQPVLSLAREWRHCDWRSVAWGVLGRLPGVVAGAWLLVRLPPRPTAVVVGALVVAAAMAQWRRWHVATTPATLTGAGFVAGLMGTTAGFGGPPMALVYSQRSGPVVRASLALFFLIGALMTMPAYVVTGRLGTVQVMTTLAVLPFLVVGAWLARPLSRHIDAGRTKPAVLALAIVGGVVLIATNLR